MKMHSKDRGCSYISRRTTHSITRLKTLKHGTDKKVLLRAMETDQDNLREPVAIKTHSHTEYTE